MVFVACAPSCVFGWHSQPARLGPVSATTSAHGSFAPKGLCCPSHPRYYDPIRQSRQLLLISQDRWLYRRPSPDDPVWAAAETFPALGQHSFHTCRHLYAGRRSRSISPMSPCSHRLHPHHLEGHYPSVLAPTSSCARGPHLPTSRPPLRTRQRRAIVRAHHRRRDRRREPASGRTGRGGGTQKRALDFLRSTSAISFAPGGSLGFVPGRGLVPACQPPEG
jgi:hypothetical protein